MRLTVSFVLAALIFIGIFSAQTLEKTTEKPGDVKPFLQKTTPPRLRKKLLNQAYLCLGCGLCLG